MVEGFQRKKMKNRAITFIVITIMLLPYLPIPTVQAVHDPWDQYRFWKQVHGGKEPIENLRNYLAYEHLEHLKLILYLLLLGIYTENVTNDLLLNLDNYVLLNPSPLEPSLLNVMNFFIFNLQVAFILAIAATALYIIFAAGTPKKRAMAKSMISRLVIGMLLVSVSPYIMDLFLNFTSGIAETILNQSDSSVAATVYTDLLWKTYWPSVFIIMTPMIGHSIEGWTHHAVGSHHGVAANIKDKYIEEAKKDLTIDNDAARDELIEVISGGNPETLIADYADDKMKTQQDMIKTQTEEIKKTGAAKARNSNWGKLEYYMDYMKVAPRPEQTFAFLMSEIALIIGLYGFLALRYIMLMMWTILFPVSVFLSSFQLTRGIGKNMVEQTIFWSILQIFYALTIDIIAVGFTILPSGFNYFGLGLQFAGISLFFISFFSVAAAILLLLTPILVLMFSQRLTQMDVG